jgi:hypothetical protein
MGNTNVHPDLPPQITSRSEFDLPPFTVYRIIGELRIGVNKDGSGIKYYKDDIFYYSKLVNTKKICDFTIYTSNDFNLWNNQLSYYNINSFQHRILFRLNTYIYKILHYKNSPRNLSILFIFNSALNKKYSLRNTNDLYIPSIGRYNDNGEKQFDYFFSKFINEIMSKNEIELDFDLFKTRAKNNINLLFLDFVVIFINFDLNFKKCFKTIKNFNVNSIITIKFICFLNK